MSDKLPESIFPSNPSSPLVMQGTFAKQGSRAYLVAGIKDGMSLGFKLMALAGPVMIMGVRVRIAWEPGHADLETARVKFKEPLIQGSTPTNAGYYFGMPFLKGPVHHGMVRDEWELIGGNGQLADFLINYMEKIGCKQLLTREQIFMHLSTEFDDAFPQLSGTDKSIDSEVMGLKKLQTYLEQFLK